MFAHALGARLRRLAANPVVLDLVLLAATVWVAHFWHFRALGLYEDDYTHTSPALGWQVSDMLAAVAGAFRYWDLGRPLGFALGWFLSFVGARLGGLPGMYVIAFLIHSVNASLFYLLFRRMGQRGIGLIGGVLFALFPADTTHAFLMHSFGLHTSLTFLLLACHAYLSERKVAAYLLAACCLLIYETPYAVFLGVPLLLRPWNKRLPRELLKHAVVWLAILAAVLAIRLGLGEGRIEQAGLGSTSLAVTLAHIATASVIGPAVSIGRFWEGPLWAIAHWNTELTAVFGFGAGLFALMLMRLRAGAAAGPSSPSAATAGEGHAEGTGLWARAGGQGTFKLLAASVPLLALAYAFSFTHYPPTATAGRLTSVHMAATFGGALLGAALLWALVGLMRPWGVALVSAVATAAFLGILLAYSFSIQQAFEATWRNERRFWTRLLVEVPDAGEGTIILVSDQGLPHNPFINASSWADPLVLQQIYDFPAVWTSPPRVFVLEGNWENAFSRDGAEVRWMMPAATWPAHEAVLPEGNTILIVYTRGSFRRIAGPIEVDGQPFALKDPGSMSRADWQRGPLYPLLIPDSH